MQEQELKRCSRCDIEKSITAFYKNKSRKDGLCHSCKECNKIQAKASRTKHFVKRQIANHKWYERNKEHVRAYDLKWRALNPEKDKASRKAWRENNKEKINLARKNSRASNPEKLKLQAHQWYLKRKESGKLKSWRDNNRQKINEWSKEWTQKNPLKVKEINRKKKLKRPEIYRAAVRMYQMKKVHATPPWAKELMREFSKAIYAKAKELSDSTGVLHHVDHIFPIRGKNCSGLHVPWNLQILTEKENVSKSNKLPEIIPTLTFWDEYEVKEGDKK